MNKIFKLIGCAALGVMALASCSPEDFTSPNGNLPVAANYEDNVTVTVDQETNYAYFNFKSAKGVTPVWVIDGNYASGDFSAKKYYRKAGTYSVECWVKNANGLSKDSIAREFTIDKTIMNGFGGFDSKSDKNLFKTATVKKSSCYYAPGWSQIADPDVKMNGNDFTVVLPAATFEKWQCQIPMETNICTKAEEDVTYDFSVILTSNTDHGGVTIKLTNPDNDGDFYFEEQQKLKAGEPVCFYITKMPSRDIDNLKLFFDFGGNAENTEVVVENITFMKSSDNEIEAPEKGEPEPVWVAIDSEDNLWNKANPVQADWYYAPGWNSLPAPDVKVNGRSYTFTLPNATWERWQAQLPYNTDLGFSDTDTEYDFIAVIESSTEFTAHVKLSDVSDNTNALFDEDTKLVAGGEKRFFVTKAKMPKACEKVELRFDFGTNPDNTEITIKDIILQKHRE